MKTYEVIIDLGSKTYHIEAENPEEATNKAIKEFEALSYEDRADEYWVGDCYELKDGDQE